MTRNVFSGSDQVVSGGSDVIVPYDGSTAAGSVGVSGTATGSAVAGAHVRVTQAGIEGALKPNANARVSQAAIETVLTPPIPSAVVTQVGIEATTQAHVVVTAGVTQAGVEGTLTPTDAVARLTQAGVEGSLTPTDAKARVTQAGEETTISPTDMAGRVTLVGVEVAVQIVHHKRTYAQFVGL